MNTNQHPNGFMYESRIAELESKVAALEKDNDDIHELAEHYRVENGRLREDEARLRFLADEPFCDGFGGVDLHDAASAYATNAGRDEPNSDDYLSAVRFAIDRARTALEPKQ